MIRRSPTRIELKLEDLNEFTQTVRKEYESAKELRMVDQKGWIHPKTTKTTQEIIHERIGYNPQPRPTE